MRKIILLAALFALAGCAGGAKTPEQVQADIQFWDMALKNSIALARDVIVLNNPPGPKRDQAMRVLDQVQTYDALGAAIYQLTATGAYVPTTQPVK